MKPLSSPANSIFASIVPYWHDGIKVSRQSPCCWNRSQCLVPYILPWKDSQDYFYFTNWLLQLLFPIFLKLTGFQHFTQHPPHIAEIRVLHLCPLLLALDWHCSLRQLVALDACCHTASDCELFKDRYWEGHNQLCFSGTFCKNSPHAAQ